MAELLSVGPNASPVRTPAIAATTEKLQNGESYGNSRNSASTSHLSSVAEDQGSSGLHLSNSSSSLLRPSPYHHNSYDSTGNSGQGGRFLQDIHVPSRMPQRMPTPMPTRSHHYQHARDVRTAVPPFSLACTMEIACPCTCMHILCY